MPAENKHKNLFKEFPPVSTSTWEELIRKDVKIDDLQNLNRTSSEGFKIKPFYRSEDLENLVYNFNHPGEYPFIRGYRSSDNAWEIQQDIFVDDIKNANKKALSLSDKGIHSIGFILGNNVLTSPDIIQNLIQGLDLEALSLHFISCNNPIQIIEYLLSACAKFKINPSRINGSASFDPLTYITFNGSHLKNKEDDLNTLAEALSKASKTLSGFRILSINGYKFREAGATAVQELAFSAAMLSDYLSFITDMSFDIHNVSKHTRLNLGIGGNYFIEIAKIRAARFLIAKIFNAYGAKKEACKVHIHSVTSDWNKTLYDPYVNVLRATSESMSAVIGGTDSLSVKPLDSIYQKSERFSERIARNIQMILKEEAYFDKIADASAGSYYIENLTSGIITEAWKLFRLLEEKGGYLESLKSGYVQDLVHDTADKRKKKITMQKEILLGTNKYPNRNEHISDKLHDCQVLPEDGKKEHKETEPVKIFRGATDLEVLRLAADERKDNIPGVFILPFGNIGKRKARAAFAVNFFAAAGYKIIDNQGFENINEGINEAGKANADIIVFCSSDDEYAGLVSELPKIYDLHFTYVVAGAPPCIDDLKVAGIPYFIHVRSDLTETIRIFHKLFGII